MPPGALQARTYCGLRRSVNSSGSGQPPDVKATFTRGLLSFRGEGGPSLQMVIARPPVGLPYTYAEFELERTYNNLSAWFNFGGQETAWTDGPQASPLEYTENSVNSDFGMGTGQDSFRNELGVAGFNLLWDATDQLRHTFC